MQKNRLEAFSDGVLAIVITIMVLELKVPHGTDWSAITPIIPTALSYLLSFVYIAIYWNNHHHMLHMTTRITGGILWANLNLLFLLSLFPFVTAWMGENHFAIAPTVAYGCVLLTAAISYYVLQQVIIHTQGSDSKLKKVVGKDPKGKLSLLFYLVGIFLSLMNQWIGIAIYTLVALIWIIPDRRIERHINKEETQVTE